mmetsp:Transcript_97596/g.135656  ORF Transcript_97596/g.135656 Transcript_97596/m.135656 type:complete len:203 (+) Transcript_97596:258-866(+)
MVFQLYRCRTEGLSLACINGCLQLIIRYTEGIKQTLNPEHCSPFRLVGHFVLLSQCYDTVVDVLLLSIAVRVVSTGILLVTLTGWQLEGLLLFVAFDLLVIILADLVTAKLFVWKRCRHGNVASLFLQEEGVIGIRKIFLHVNEVVTNGRHWSSFVHHACGSRSWKNLRLFVGIAKGLPLIFENLTCNDASSIIVRPHGILD